MMSQAENQTPNGAPLLFGDLAKASKTKPFEMIDALWRNAPLVLALGIPLFIFFYLTLSVLVIPTYIAKGTILVKQLTEPGANGRERELIMGDVATYQRTLALRVLNTGLLAKAISSMKEDQKPAFLKGVKDPKTAAMILADKLTATQIDGTYIINVSLRGNKPHGLANTLDAVLKTLLQQLQIEQEDQYGKRLLYLHNEYDSLAALQESAKEKVIAMANKYGNKSFLRSSYTADLTKIELIQRLYYESAAQVLAKEGLMKKAEKDREELAKLDISPIAEEFVASSLGLNMIEQFNYAQQESLRSTIDGLTTNNIERLKVESNIQAMKDYQTHYRENLDAHTIQIQTAKRNLQLDGDVIKARNDYLASKTDADKLNEMLNQAEEEVSLTSEGVFEANELNLALAQLRERLIQVNTRIGEEELLAKAPIPVVIGQQPVASDTPDSKNGKKVLLLALLASFGLLAGLCLSHDALSESIQSRSELGAAIGGLGCDPIPNVELVNNETFTKICLKPGVPSEVPLRDLALRLILEHQRAGARIISFVGAHPGTGNSSIALSVARAISGSGFDVLLSELPSSRPGLAKIAGLPEAKQPDLTPWVSKTFDPESTTEIIPWIPGVPTDLVRATLNSFLENALKISDLILLDVPPLSSSDIARSAAVRSDVVIITASQSVANYSDVRSTVEWIAGGGVSAVSTVLNFQKENYFRARVISYLGILNTLLLNAKQLIDNLADSEILFVKKITESERYKSFRDRLLNLMKRLPSLSKDDRDAKK